MRRLLALAIAAPLLLTACGDDDAAPEPVPALQRAAASLGEIRSAHLDLSMTIRAGGSGKPVGFEIRGPFALGDEPRADIDVKQLAPQRAVRIVLVDDRAYAVREGLAYELPQERAQALRDVAASGRDLGSIRVDRWLRSPTAREGERIDGVATTRIDAQVDVAALLTDLTSLARRLRAAGPLAQLDRDDVTALAASVRSATASVWSGSDGVLRRLDLSVSLGDASDSGVPREFAALLPVTAELSLTLTDVGEPVDVEAPKVR